MSGLRQKVLAAGVGALATIVVAGCASTASSVVHPASTPSSFVAPSTTDDLSTSAVTTSAAPQTSHTSKPAPKPTTSAKTTAVVHVVTPPPSKAPIVVKTTPVAPKTTAAAPACYPLTNGGNCYEPGEYCRNSDHGATGIAGDGKRIKCEDNNGWRWEPY